MLQSATSSQNCPIQSAAFAPMHRLPDSLRERHHQAAQVGCLDGLALHTWCIFGGETSLSVGTCDHAVRERSCAA